MQSSVLRKLPMVGATFQVEPSNIPDCVDTIVNDGNNEKSNLLFVRDSAVPVSFDNILKLKSMLVVPGLILLVPVDALTPTPAVGLSGKPRTLVLVESINEKKMVTVVNIDGSSTSVSLDNLATYVSSELVIAKITEFFNSKSNAKITMKEYEKYFQTSAKNEVLKAQWSSLMMECFLFLLFRLDNNLRELCNHLLTNFNAETYKNERIQWCKDDIIRNYFTFRTEDTTPEYGIANVKSLQRKFNFQIDSSLKVKVVGLFQKADDIIRKTFSS